MSQISYRTYYIKKLFVVYLEFKINYEPLLYLAILLPTKPYFPINPWGVSNL